MDEIFGSLVKLGYRVWSKCKDKLSVAVGNGISAIQSVLCVINQGLLPIGYKLLLSNLRLLNKMLVGQRVLNLLD